MTMRHLNIFVTVCQQNSITKAAKKLYLSQPAVSIAVKELEDYYQVQLFERYGHKIYLTEVGKKTYDYAVHIASLFDEMESAIGDWGEKGKIRIGASITIGNYLMPGYIKRYKERYPQVTPIVTINSSDLIEQMILSNEIDVGLIEGMVHSDNIMSLPFLEDTLVIICGCENLLLKKKAVKIQDLKEQDLLLREKNSGTRELIDSVFALHDIIITPVWESTSTHAIIDAVSMEIGISILPLRLVQEAVAEGKVKILSAKGVEFKRQFHFVYHKNKYLSENIQNFKGLCCGDKGGEDSVSNLGGR